MNFNINFSFHFLKRKTVRNRNYQKGKTATQQKNILHNCDLEKNLSIIDLRLLKLDNMKRMILTLIIVFCFHEVVYGRNQQINPEPKLTQSKSILYTNLFLQLFLWHTKTKKVILTRI